MSDPQDGTFAKLMELQESTAEPTAAEAQPGISADPKPPHSAPPATSLPAEDLSTVPYISQNYRFTDDELRWLRRSAFDFSEQSGIKISQNTILRVALRDLRDACERNAKSNPLIRAISRLKK